jgi:DNA-binding NarL/FixJ family response regulator
MVAVNRAQVLVLGVPGRLQECLRSLLKAVPELEVLGADKGYWPLADMNGQKPDLVVLDFGSQTEEMARDLAWINAHWPGASCLVVADTARQLQAARAAGASGVLLRGFAAGEFFGVLHDLLQGQFGLGREAAEPGNEARASASECDPSLGEDRALLASPVVF